MSVTPFERITPAYEIPSRKHHDRDAGAQTAPPRHGELQRPHVRGKFLQVDDEKFWVRGVTYGTFRPDGAGVQFPGRAVVERDFQAIAAAGFNAIRVYTLPPRWLLDVAMANGLRVMVGIWWEQYTTFLDDGARARHIVRKMRADVAGLAGHPAVLCFVLANEIPAAIVRWHGKSRIESFIRRLYETVKSEDPGALVTYVNFPSTEYLELPFLDFAAFNVYLETRETFDSYLARLHNLAGERPLVMAEFGLDSRRNGESAQAESLRWQLAAAFESGCAGAFVFSWTDEWHCAGCDIDDWDFGLVTRDRRPKLALQCVSNRLAEVPFAIDQATWPKVSVVVCSYNGSRTVGETLATLANLAYPDYEVIVVDDGSTDQTSAIADRYKVKLFRTENNGLSAARNLGMNAASGDIIAYIDDDAYPDPHWLTFLVSGLRDTEHAGIGGPNIAPPGDGAIADCVANAPGGPVHVLLSDRVAEHIPGCNMAYRRDKLLVIGGFDPRFRVAGDDVGVCWRLQERGWTIGFAPAAVVWHHRRGSLRAYLKQQKGYAKAEALLAEKWPGKYNGAGHPTWHGRLYGKGIVKTLLKPRIYHGTWGTAPFQKLYEPNPGSLSSLPLMPEWYFVLFFLAALSALGTFWAPLRWMLVPLAAGLVISLLQSVRAAVDASFPLQGHSRSRRLPLKVIVALLHLVQPIARLAGRIQHGLGPWRWRDLVPVFPRPTRRSFWSEEWQAPEARLAEIERILRKLGAVVVVAGDFEPFDLTVRSGLFGSIRTIAATEEHGGGKQMFRLSAWPTVPGALLAVLLALAAPAWLAVADGAWVIAIVLAVASVAMAGLAYADCAVAMKDWRDAINEYQHRNRCSPLL
jgi:O-antigen biosynthesis protein